MLFLVRTNFVPEVGIGPNAGFVFLPWRLRGRSQPAEEFSDCMSSYRRRL
jgi:hypothetical protein